MLLAILPLSIALVAPSTGRAERISARNYSTSDGLVCDEVNRVFQDARGFIWISTPDGLVLFDGYGFAAYGRDDGLPHPFVDPIVENPAGVYWLGTDNGVCRMDLSFERGDPRRSTVFPLGASPQSNQVRGLCLDRGGQLWAGTGDGVFRLAPGGLVFEPIELTLDAAAGRDVRAVIEGDDGSIWIAIGRELVRIPPGGAPLRHRLPVLQSDGVTALLSAPPELWIGSSRGLAVATPRPANLADADELMEQRTVDSRPSTGDRKRPDGGVPGRSPGVRALCRSSTGEIWAATDTGLIVTNGARVRRITLANGLTDDSITSVMEDRNGHVWVGTANGGVDKIIANGLTSYVESDGVPAGPIRSIFESASGELCIVTASGATARFVGNRFLPAPGRTAASSSGLPHAATGVGIRGPADEWQGPDPNRYRTEVRLARGVTEAAPSAAYADGRGAVWIGFRDGAVVRVRDGAVTRVELPDAASSGDVQCFFGDAAGRLWVGFRHGGLVRLDDPAGESPGIRPATTGHGLPSDSVSCVTEDAWGRIYAGTPRGIARIDPATGSVRLFTTADGLAHNGVSAAFRDRSGSLWFGTSLGVSRIVPAPDPPPMTPPVFITGLRIAGVARTVSELGETELQDLSLGVGDNNIQIDFLGLGPGDDLRYLYTLEGAGTSQRHETSLRSVDFASLAPGSYRFVVQAIDGSGQTSPRQAVVTFTIPPPVWQRWWFFGILGLLAGAGILGFHRVRLARLLELERVRTRIATDLHDDIGSSLTQIAILCEIARTRAKGGALHLSDHLDKIAATSRELVDSMSDVVWAINPMRDQLRDVVQRMRRFAADLFDARDVRFRFRAPGPDRDVAMDADERREAYLVFKECLNNAIRHSGCTFVDIHLEVEGSWLTLTVTDNGAGFDPAESSDGHGLESMRKRAASLGGTFRIASGPPAGTTATLRFPLGRRRGPHWLSARRAVPGGEHRRIPEWPFGIRRPSRHDQQHQSRLGRQRAHEGDHGRDHRRPA